MANVAILGASGDRSKFGNKSLRAHLQAGYRVFPVNPRESEIEGLTAYPTLAALPEPVERLSVYLPPAVARRLLPEIAALGAREVWFNPGAADEGLLDEAKRLGIPAIDGCSIVDLGLSPSQFS
ncbi:MAG: CoA-binding protein [Thermoanaerobaculia bacterium]